MGVMRFSFEPPDLAERWSALHDAFLVGFEHAPWRTWVDLRPGLLQCVTEVSESSALQVYWPVPDVGGLGLATTTLAERPQPYDLNVELVRGKLSRVCDVQRQLEEEGFSFGRQARTALREAMQQFLHLVYHATADEIGELSGECLRVLVELGDDLIRRYARVVREQRRAVGRMPLTIVRVTPEDVETVDPQTLSGHFGAVQLLVPWSELEPEQGEYDWGRLDRALERCERAELNVGIGPLVCWEKLALPHWLWLWADNFDAVCAFTRDFVRAVLQRYGARVRIWELASRLNCGPARLFDMNQRLQLAAVILQAANELASRSFFYVTLGQPWSEYAAKIDDCGTLFFADTLSRSELGLRGLGIEVAYGYGVGSGMSWSRDLLDTTYMLERYAALELPIVVSLAAPIMPNANGVAAIVSTQSGSAAPRSAYGVAQWVEGIMEVVASRPNVAAVVWSHLSDRHLGMYPHAALLKDDAGFHPAMAHFERS